MASEAVAVCLSDLLSSVLFLLSVLFWFSCASVLSCFRGLAMLRFRAVSSAIFARPL